MTTLLPDVDAAAASAVSAINRGVSTWHLTGPVGTGKSTALRRIASELDNRPVVLIAPPERELDAGVWALTQLSTSLIDHGYGNGDLACVTDVHEPWAAKLAAIQRALRRSKGLVIACDEPQAWLPGNYHFDERSAQVVSTILNSERAQRLVAGAPGIPFVADENVTIQGTTTMEWFADEEEWGELHSLALELREAAPQVAGLAPLAARALVGTASLTSVTAVAKLRGHEISQRAATRRFCQTLASGAATSRLREICAAIAQVRLGIDAAVLANLGLAALTPIEQSLVLHVLLDRAHGGYRAPASLRKEIAMTLKSRPSVSVSMFEHFERKATDSDGAVAHLYSMEAFHHAVEAGRVDEALRQPIYFSDQLNILGRALSTAGDRASAAAVFREAALGSPDDDYAHHYLAFNLDYQGLDAEQVEREYASALALSPGNPWWHARYITFLITRGRLDDAWEAWNRATSDVQAEDFASATVVYSNLHFWVAYTLMHAGEYDLALEVISEVPADELTTNRGFSALVDRIEAMIEARDWGSFVPGTAFHPGWWRDPPELLPDEHRGDELTIWFAGRVVEVDAESIEIEAAEIRLAVVSTLLTRPTTTAVTFGREQFDNATTGMLGASLRAGDYVQIGFYGADDSDEESVVAAVYGRRRWRTDGLPPLKPHPQRYLRRSAQLAN